MRRRVRWDNIIRVAGAALIVGLVVAWPRLAPPEPEVPGPEPAPLTGGEAEEPPGDERDAREVADDREVRDTADRDRDRRVRRRKPTRRHEQAAAKGGPAVTGRRDPAATPRPAPAATPRPDPPPARPRPSPPRPRPAPSPDPDPARTEFGFESG